MIVRVTIKAQAADSRGNNSPRETPRTRRRKSIMGRPRRGVAAAPYRKVFLLKYMG